MRVAIEKEDLMKVISIISILLLVLVIAYTVPLTLASGADSRPNLFVREQWWKDSFKEWVDSANGKYRVIYRVENNGDASASASNTTINITTVSGNGNGPLSYIIKDHVPQLDVGEAYDGTLGPFTCSCNDTVILTICADGDYEIREASETDNCREETINCPASACKPDLVIEDYAVTWVNRSDKTFNVSCTVANIGNGGACESTTCIHGNDRLVPALAPGENYSCAAGPFILGGHETGIEICSDTHNNVRESSEANNCHSGTLGVPDLQMYIASKDWIDAPNRTYSITATVCNNGGAESMNATVSVYIDCNLIMVVNYPPVDGYGNCVEKTFLPFTMSGNNDTIRICVEWVDGTRCDESVLVYGGCLATDGSGRLFTCGDRVDRSCTFTGDMYCATQYSGKDYPHGLFIAADDVTIDGNGYAIVGDRSACFKQYAGTGYVAWTGIRCDRYSNVTIKNLEIRNFCNGISIENGDNSTLKDCDIHDNGATVQYNYGITVVNSSYTTIDGCSIRNSTGILADMNVCGGHGVNLDCGSNHCDITNNTICSNNLSGICASPTCKYLSIRDNLLCDNGRQRQSGFCTGINLHWKGGHLETNSTVERNVIRNTTGSGIYVAQGAATIRDNIVTKSRNGTDVTGNGILVDDGKLTFLYNNTCCCNEGADIVNAGFATFGDCNTCGQAVDYDDCGTIGCIYYCDGRSGSCVGEHYNFSCGMVINESCVFSRSMSGCGGLIAGADNITIDGCGYTITGIGMGNGVFSNRTNVTIKNLQIKNFRTGIVVEATAKNTIKNCTLRKNLLTGINISCDDCNLCNNRVYDNGGDGIVVAGNNNTFEDNTAARNCGHGLYLGSGASKTVLTENAIGDNCGIDIYRSQGAETIGNNNTCDTTHQYSDAGYSLPDGCIYPWRPPDLIISRKEEYWVNTTNKTYVVKYTIENIGDVNSREATPSTTYLYIDDHHNSGADDRIGSLKPGESQTRTFEHTPEISCEKDRIRVCADGLDEVSEHNCADKFYCNGVGCYIVEELFSDGEANNCLINTFKERGDELNADLNAACVGLSIAYRCGDTVEDSCTFNGSMRCSAGHGLVIGKDGITIDGNGYTLIGPGNASCAHISESDPGAGDCGILNNGYDMVTIKDLTVEGFCNGIALRGSGSNPAKGNTIETCVVRRNGNPDDGTSHGIHFVRVEGSTVSGSEIYDNTGTGESCGDGGNGIFTYLSCNNIVKENLIHGNRKGGIFMKMKSKSNEVTGNTIHENGQGGIILRCANSDENIIAENAVLRNYGDGIYIGSNRNTIRDNTVEGNSAGHRVGDTPVEDGDGIDMGRSDGSGANELYGNSACGNEGVDIHVCHADGGGNHGRENCCDETTNYDDNGVTGCSNSCEDRSKPDLTITNKLESWDNPENPDDLRYNITATVANIGKADAPASIIRIIIDGDWSDYPVPILNASEQYPNTIGTFTMSGDRDEITICADPEGAIDEICEDNNCLTTVWYAMPDLIVTAIDAQPPFTLGALDTATATVKNVGTIATGESFEVALSINGNKEVIDEIDGKLSPDETKTVSFEWVPLASNRLTVFADSKDELVEWDETNNNMTITASIGVGPTPPQAQSKEGVHSSGISAREYDYEANSTDVNVDLKTHRAETNTLGNESESVMSAMKKVSARLFKSTLFFSESGGEVVTPEWTSVAIAALVASLFCAGFYGEITRYRRKSR